MKKLGLIVSVIVLVTALSLFAACGTAETPPVLTIGAVYVGAINDYGYNQALHESIQKIKANIPGVKIIEAENVPEGAATAPMQLMINQNATLIFATSYGYHDEAFNLSVAHPGVDFEWCGGGSPNITANFGEFFGQPPDGWYLMGMAAALMTKNLTNPKFGFVAAFPLGWTRTFINAFTLGAQSVYPPCVPNATSPVTVQVAYTYDWANLAKQVLTTNALIDAGASVITMHVDAPRTVIETAETRGVYSIGYQSVEANIFAPTKWISGLGFSFGDLLTPIAQSVINGTFVGASNMWGWNTTAMVLAPWGPSVNSTVKNAVLAAKAEFEAGNLTVFKGPIYDTTGNIAACHFGWWPFVLNLTANVTIPDNLMGWADDFFVWGVNVTG